MMTKITREMMATVRNFDAAEICDQLCELSAFNDSSIKVNFGEQFTSMIPNQLVVKPVDNVTEVIAKLYYGETEVLESEALNLLRDIDVTRRALPAVDFTQARKLLRKLWIILKNQVNA